MLTLVHAERATIKNLADMDYEKQALEEQLAAAELKATRVNVSVL